MLGNFIIGLGGGSILDTAKALPQWRPMKGTVWDYIHSGSGKGKVTQNLLHFVANTTMTGTDKEAGAGMWFKGGCEYG